MLKDLLAELAALARQYQAFRRARKIKSVAELLRLVLLFAGLDWSAREIAAKVVLVYRRTTAPAQAASAPAGRRDLVVIACAHDGQRLASESVKS